MKIIDDDEQNNWEHFRDVKGWLKNVEERWRFKDLIVELIIVKNHIRT